jgi:hypothetical protein
MSAANPSHPIEGVYDSDNPIETLWETINDEIRQIEPGKRIVAHVFICSEFEIQFSFLFFISGR